MKFHPDLEKWRIVTGDFRSARFQDCGAFTIPGPCSQELTVLATSGRDKASPTYPWEHVSVSTPRRCPNWIEMCFIKDLFWGPEECVLQYHVPASQQINNHPHCLHMWAPVGVPIPMPPAIAVGLQKIGTIKPGEIPEEVIKQMQQVYADAEKKSGVQ